MALTKAVDSVNSVTKKSFTSELLVSIFSRNFFNISSSVFIEIVDKLSWLSFISLAMSLLR
ncbi:hypothetical protein [Mycoplasma feriruminatoris]|uniref:hypothetical protein n=1 Tax=Mycoplasma feriruminatoris TaxID=1179777 RepID=UPI00241F7D6B|nr:hypothetical protein [Mycoplasma feriruminatoris]